VSWRRLLELNYLKERWKNTRETQTELKIEVFRALQMGFGTSKIPQGKQPFKT